MRNECVLYMLVLAPKLVNHSAETMANSYNVSLRLAVYQKVLLLICLSASRPRRVSILQTMCCGAMAVFRQRQPAKEARSCRM